MVVRLALLCAVEGAIVALLAIEVCRDPAPLITPGAPPRGSVPEVATDGDAVGRPAGQRSSQTPAPDAPARHEVIAKWNGDDPVGVLLLGSLTLRDGSPADASINATLEKERRYASAAADGSFALVGLRPGDWQVTLRGTSVVEAEETLTITDAAVQHRDFVLDGTFAVRVLIVTPDGEDATMAKRKAQMHGFGDFTVAGQRDRFPDRLAATDYGRVFVGDARWSGEMNPKDGYAGTLHLTSVPAHVALLQRHLVLEQQLVQRGQQEVKFTVDIAALEQLAATATVRVVDAVSGAPIANARVALNTSNRMAGGQPVDAQGNAVIEGLSPGLLRCQVSAPEHESYWHIVRVEPGQRLDLGEIRLGPQQPLTGTVLGPNSEPAGGEVQWTELKWRTGPAEFYFNRSARIDADGTFELHGSGAGPIAVQARGADGLLAAGVFDNPAAAPVVLRLAPASECIVTRPADPTRSFTLTIYDARRRAITAHAIEPRSTKKTIRLPAGDYAFDVHDDHDRVLQSGRLTFGETPCTVEIR